MKVLILTSNHLRHKYLINRIAEQFDEVMAVVETQSHATGKEKTQSIEVGDATFQHFQNIISAEKKLFSKEVSIRNCLSLLPIQLGEIHFPFVKEAIIDFAPECAIVFGSSWVKEPLFSALPKDKSLNIHMGLSPFYRGHSTNFWAFCEGEPEMVGGTILKLHQGLDEGDIVAHVRPEASDFDNYYDFSMSVVKTAVDEVIQLIQGAEGQSEFQGQEIKGLTRPEKYFTSKDFTNSAATEFLKTHKESYLRYLSDLKQGKVSQRESLWIESLVQPNIQKK